VSVDLTDLPPVLAAQLKEHLENYRSLPGSAAVFQDPALSASLARVWACSEFVARYCIQHPKRFAEFAASGALTRSLGRESLMDAVLSELEGISDEREMLARLRSVRNRELVRIAWRDLATWAQLEETLHDLSVLAEASIRAALRFASDQLAERFGIPRNDAGEAQQFIVLAMGKLGGGELNFSSDVDLVFLYGQAGESDGPRRLSNEKYFSRLGQLLIRLLDTQTEEGFVYRVDMRLRPFGQSGPLAMSLSAFELYLEQHGREWERYAYIKSRAICGIREDVEQYEEILRPFVYRRYLDYGVFESLREMKALIASEMRRRDLRADIKRGPGGIREIEFIAQAFQLLRGGTIKKLRRPELLEILPAIAEAGLMPDRTVGQLTEAYGFLRAVENRLQAYCDQQTHELPDDDDARARQRLAFSMGFRDWDGFSAVLESHRKRVSRDFDAIVLGETDQQQTECEAAVRFVWEQAPDADSALRQLSEAGVSAGGASVEFISRLRDGAFHRRLHRTGKARLAAIVPMAIQAADRLGSAERILPRLATIVEAVGRRTAYLALIKENPVALDRLIRICAYGDFLVRRVAEYPLLLDELLDARVFEEPPTNEEFSHDLGERFANLASDDLELQIDALRQFQRASVFRVAVGDLGGKLPLMKVSDRLTAIAELVLDKALSIARQQLVERHGAPRCGPEQREAGFAVVAYGKLGGIELGYGSDLDLVFVHDSEGEAQQTDGPKPLENGLFFARLARRITHLLTIQTTSGVLYEVDTRLRPSGKAGLLVTSLAAFESYQREQAWTWEHQALLRARPVAGDDEVIKGFAAIREQVLRESVRRDSLRDDVRDMRERMRRELSKSGPGTFDIKQDWGGVADIEFLVQYWVLRWCPEYPELLRYSDNIRQLEGLAETGCVPRRTTELLIDTYRGYRKLLHRAYLSGISEPVAEADVEELREPVRGIWNAQMEG